MPEKDYFKHIEYINNPKQWVSWPFCPMLRRGEKDPIDREHGVIYLGHSLSVIKKVNLFMLPETEREFLEADGWVYNSVEEMVADGWEVD